MPTPGQDGLIRLRRTSIRLKETQFDSGLEISLTHASLSASLGCLSGLPDPLQGAPAGESRETISLPIGGIGKSSMRNGWVGKSYESRIRPPIKKCQQSRFVRGKVIGAGAVQSYHSIR